MDFAHGYIRNTHTLVFIHKTYVALIQTCVHAQMYTPARAYTCKHTE